jgi:hypothetical membrane protein
MNTKRIKSFNDHYPLIGPVAWMLSIQYFVVQLVVARAWALPFSLLHNTISDLGNTACAPYGSRFVCSPRHELMNASFILLGVTMFAGASLMYHEFHSSRANAIGFGAMALAGLGTVLVGAFPENTIGGLHILGASLPFLVGNGGMIILSQGLTIPRALRVYTLLSGIIGLVGLVLFMMNHYLGLGTGGMERVTAYPQTVWLIVFGCYVSRNHFTHRV